MITALSGSMIARATSILLVTVAAITAAFGQPATQRQITFNGRPLTPEQQQRLEMLERAYRVRIPDNHYWYDNRSGAAGFWKGPAIATLPPGLGLGGPMPANCSGGGTGVFVNGRELHWFDVAVLSQLGPVYRGRYWAEANGNFGVEGGPVIGNVYVLAQGSNRPSQGQRRVYSPGELSGLTGNSAGYCTSAGNCWYPGQ